MASSRRLRFACIGATAALGLLLVYWAALSIGGPFFLVPPGGHDGGYCYGFVENAQPGVTYSAPCGVSMTPEFIVALAAMIVATGAGIAGLARGARRSWQIALFATTLAFGIVVFESAASLGGDWAAGLNGSRGPIHLTLVAAVLLTFAVAARAPRNREAAPASSAASE